MGFESGGISFRAFYVPGSLGRESVADFAAHAAPPIETLGHEPLSGWVTGRHMLDRNITEDTAIVAGYLRLTLMKAERKIPEALLRAECRMEELAQASVREGSGLKRSERIAIRKEVKERLLPTMPPTLTGIDIVADPQTDLLYATATSDKQVDALNIAVRQATGKTIIPVMPSTAAMRRKQVNVGELRPCSFSPECEDDAASDSLGQDFLTWIWFHSEAGGGMAEIGNSRFGVIVEGPLTFVLEGDGAFETVVRKGAPLVSAEAKTALLCGKKLRSARVTLVRDEETWSVTLDAEEFIFRGLKMPKGDGVDPVSRFHERMLSMHVFREGFMAFFDRFLEERANAARWTQTLGRIHSWAKDRKSLK